MAAKVLLLSTKIQESHKEELETKNSYIKSLAGARKAIKDVYKNLISGVDLDSTNGQEEPKEKAKNKGSPKKSETSSEETSLENESTAADSENKDSGNENSEGEIPDETEDSVSSENSEKCDVISGPGKRHRMNNKREPHEIDTKPNSELISDIKEKASKKVDTHWTKGHPVYEKLKSGQNRESETERQKGLNGVRKGHLFADDLPDSNEYVKEAKRIYPQGFALEKKPPPKVVDNVKNVGETKDGEKRQNSAEQRTSSEDESSSAKSHSHKAKISGVSQTRTIAQINKNSMVLNSGTDDRDKVKEKEQGQSKAGSQRNFKNRVKIKQVSAKEEDELKQDREYIERYQDSIAKNTDAHEVRVCTVNKNGSKNSSKGALEHTYRINVPKVHFQSNIKRGSSSTPVCNSERQIPDAQRPVITPNNNNDKDELKGNGRSVKPTTVGNTSLVLSDQSSSSLQSSDKDSISAAVQIVKSRSKFYDSNKHLTVSAFECVCGWGGGEGARTVSYLTLLLNSTRKVTYTFTGLRDCIFFGLNSISLLILQRLRYEL